jgi:large subunit ribosomal protein L18
MIDRATMKTSKLKMKRRGQRKQRIRKSVFGTPDQPRLTVYRSLNHIYAQIVDDLSGRTLVSADSVQAEGADGGNIAGGTAVGARLAEKAKAAGVQRVAFDRNGFRFHGRVKALADAARKGGLKF